MMMSYLLFLLSLPAVTIAALSVWATEEKIWKEEQRPEKERLSSLWDGKRVNLASGKNEVVSFALVLEASGENVQDVNIKFAGFPGIRARGAYSGKGEELFDWSKVEAEVFYVRYLQVKGIPKDYSYDERLLPLRMQRPWEAGHLGVGKGNGSWKDRPGAEKHWPDIAVPIELHPGFKVDAGFSQMIWVDVFVPKTACPGKHTGVVDISWSKGSIAVDVQLSVHRFTLPDRPSLKTMLPIEGGDILRRYTGQNWVHCTKQHETRKLFDRHYQLAWRHRVSVVSGSFDACVAPESPKQDEPHPFDVDRLSGKTFTPEEGYGGPGVGVGVGVYPVGLYGKWRKQWEHLGEEGMRLRAGRWAKWFKNAPAPINETVRFLYLIDESHDYPQMENWSIWAEGTGLDTMATLRFTDAVEKVPNLDIACSTLGFASTSRWEDARKAASKKGRPRLWMYNGGRPASGGFEIEDEASGPRSVSWAMRKKKIELYFYWMATYYTNYQGSEGAVDVFNRAQTFGKNERVDPQKGQTGWMYRNGDGVLMYPGTDKQFPKSDYGVPGPFASLRLKYWRRGLQDIDYLELLRSRRGDAAVEALLQGVMPKALWEVDVPDPNDPSWARTNVSWPEAWDAWEKVRLEMIKHLEEPDDGATCTPVPPPGPAPPPVEKCHPTGGAIEWAAGGGKLRVWATEEKIMREEQKAVCSAAKTHSTMWDGSSVSIFGARNEIVSFALVLEAHGGQVDGISVSLASLGPLRSRSQAMNDSDSLFDWRQVELELFYVRYLEIRGLSYNPPDERLVPRAMRRKWMAAAGGGGLSFEKWEDRPGANKHMPEIAVPIELHEEFSIQSGQSQMIWVDVYIPKTMEPGKYTGNVKVSVKGADSLIPIQLEVRKFSLPDKVTSKTMLPIEGGDILRRYIGQNWVHCSKDQDDIYRRLWERHWQVAWRHRVTLVDGSFDSCLNYRHRVGDVTGDLETLRDQPRLLQQFRLNGSAFTTERNYSGPGMGVGQGVYPIGLYGKWQAQKWQLDADGNDIGLPAGFETHLGRWESAFRELESLKAADAQRFLYLIDESEKYEQTEQWAKQASSIADPGAQIPAMATLNLVDAVKKTPSLKITCSTLGHVNTTEWLEALEAKDKLGMRLWLYNGGRPAHGSTDTESDAVDWRTIPWAMRKHNIEMYFYWMSTYYTNYQASEGATPLFSRAKTFGQLSAEKDPLAGEKGWMYKNGDGVLLYPGTDMQFQNDSYGVWGPFASLRLKYWRRGLQDIEYIELLRAKHGEDIVRTMLQRAMPKALWEVGTKKDFPGISWDESWDSWEKIRKELADMIESDVLTTNAPTPAPNSYPTPTAGDAISSIASTAFASTTRAVKVALVCSAFMFSL